MRWPIVFTELYAERIEQLLSEYTNELERTDLKKEGVGPGVRKDVRDICATLSRAVDRYLIFTHT